MSIPKSFIVACRADGNEVMQYYAIDGPSGGYPYWSPSPRSAKPFNTVELAEECIKKMILEPYHMMANGTMNPPVMLHAGLDLCNTKTAGTGNMFVMEIVTQSVRQYPFFAKLGKEM